MDRMTDVLGVPTCSRVFVMDRMMDVLGVPTCSRVFVMDQRTYK